MSEQNAERPLTRREIRLREMAAAAEAQGNSVDTEQVEAEVESLAGAPTEPEQTAEAAGDIEISPYNEDGTPRTRREMRELREKALAERAAAEKSEEADEATATDEAVESATTETEPEAETETEVSEAAEPDDPQIDEPAETAAEDGGVAEVEHAEAPDAEAADEATEATSDETQAEEAEEVDAEEASAEDAASVDTGSEEAVSDGDEGKEAETAQEPIEPETSDSESAASEFDVPTQPFSVNDLKEAEQRFDNLADDDDKGATAEDELTDVKSEAEAEAVPPPKSGLRFPWRRSAKSASVAPAADEAPAESEPVDSFVDDRGEAVADEAFDQSPEETEPVTEVLSAQEFSETELAEQVQADATDEEGETTDERPLDVVEEAAAVDEISSSEAEPVEDISAEATEETSPEQTEYSFPNIEPPEEWRSVFDDPSTRVVPTSQGSDTAVPSEGFDDLISRAVVQEGSTGGVGSAALILPEMPDDAGVTGTLGGTGELFVTGSIEVPKSIGETGGHASLHDSVDADQLDDLKMAPAGFDGGDSGPVSARRAVSAMAQTGVPDQAQVKQDRSRLPLILSLTGGGLVVIVGGLVIWGATNGFFG